MPWYPGSIHDPVAGPGGAYVHGPFRIVHHTTEGSSYAGARAAYVSSGNAPHFTVDQHNVHQHLDTDMSATALANPPGGVQTNRQRAIQIEVVGFAGQAKNPVTLAKVASLCRWIEATHNIPRTWPNGYPRTAIAGHDPGGHNRNGVNWVTLGGHYGHSQVPENSHWDPGYTTEEVRLIMGTLPAPRLVGAIPNGAHWQYHALTAKFNVDHFEVSPAQIAAELGLTGSGSAVVPLRAAVAALGWDVGYTLEHLNDANDPRAYLWVYG